jgi:SAM-dependent methyltransferase
VTREQRLVFGEVADTYDRARPGYPEVVVDEVVARAPAPESTRFLEVGCGTGKATVPFAARGFDLLALEPSEEMAVVARRNCASYPRTSVLVTSFEEWPVPAGAFHAVFSATAWHWVQPEIRLEKAHAALDECGVLALFWNRPDWPDTPLHRAIDAVYQEVAPELFARLPGMSPHDVGIRDCVEQLEASDRFGEVEEIRHGWHADYTRDRYLELLDTQSNHRLLDPESRARLLDGVALAIDASGGLMPVSYTVKLYVARKVG